MHVGTDAEVLKLCSDVKWNCGIKVFEADLYYEGDPEANCIQLKFPDLPGAAAYVSERASRLGLANNDEARFVGALLWITYPELGGLAPIGWKLVEKCGKDSVRIGHCKPRERISLGATNYSI